MNKMETDNTKKFDFWQDHSLNYLEMAYRADKRVRLDNADGYGKKTGVCGDTVEIFIKIEEDIIQAIFYDINGCLNTNACANAVIVLGEGKKVEQAWEEITPETVIEFLETLPSEDSHCAELSVGAFYLALSNFHETKRSPWKRIYGGR